MDPVFLACSEVLEMHVEQIERYGGIYGCATGRCSSRQSRCRNRRFAGHGCILQFLQWLRPRPEQTRLLCSWF